MNILVFEQRYTRPTEAGIDRFHFFAEEWARLGHDVTVVAGTVSYISGEKPSGYKWRLFTAEEEKERFKVIRVFDSALGYRTFAGRLWSYFSYFLLAFFAGLFSKRPEVVIASSPPIFAGFLGYLVATFRGIPFVFEMRDIWPDVAVELGFLKNRVLIRMSSALERFLYRKSAAITVNSPGLKEFLVGEKGISGDKITNIPNPVDFALFDRIKDFSMREKMKWSDKIIVLYSGALSAVYDLDLILDVAGEIEKPSILFVIMGDGRQKPALMKRVREEGLENVVLLGAVPKVRVPEFIAAADICVAALKNLRLLKYVYATKLVDYMAGARPIILAMEGVSRKLVCEEAKSGVCVPPGDKEGFKRAILDLSSDAQRREKFGRNGRYFVLKNFEVKKLAADYLRILTKPVIIPKRKSN